MNNEQMAGVAARAAVHAALADPARLLITDTLAVGDVSPSELAAVLRMPSNLLAHHLHVLEQAGLLTRRRSEGDRRRSYLRLVPGALDSLSRPPSRRARRVLFVCTANSARSHLAAALWRRASKVPAASAGTHPATAIAAGAIAAAGRHHLPLRRQQPRHISRVQEEGDLIVTVCDRAREELGPVAAVHWSVPDPVPAGDPGSFDAALADLSQRVGRLATRLATAPLPGHSCRCAVLGGPADLGGWL
jgi:protein-tyrosine-phosphatase/DNA-binding HxlR family transcriptional regulator